MTGLQRTGVAPHGLQHDPRPGIEPVHRTGGLLLQHGLARGGAQPRHVHPAQQVPGRHRSRRGDLERPLSVLAQSHPQRAVVIDDRLQRVGEQGFAQAGRDPGHHRLVKPAHRPAQVPQVVHDRRRLHVAHPVLGALGGREGGGVGDLGQPCHGPAVEDVLRSDDQSRLAGPADELDRADAVAAEVEEAVVDADRAQAQHLGEQAAQHLFTYGAGRPPGRSGLEVGCGQGLPVELAVGVDGEGVQDHGRGRCHVVRQRGGDVAGQFLVGGVGVRCRGDVGDEFVVAGRGGVGGDGGVGDGGVPGENALDLPELDTEPTDLDLVVGAAQVVQHAVLVPAGQVTRAVHPRARRPIRIGHEVTGGQARSAQVAVGDLGTGKVQLARHPGRDRPQPPVEDVGAGAGQGLPDRRSQHLARIALVPAGGVDGGLGRPVQVGYPHPGCVVPQPAHQLLGQCLAREHDLVAVQGRAGVQQGREDRGHTADQRSRPRPFGERQQVGHHLDAATGQQGREDLEHRHVEGQRRRRQDPRQVPFAEALHRPGQEHRHGPAGDHHALRLPRRPRRVDHVGGGGGRGRPVGGERRVGQFRELGGGARVVQDEGRRPGGGQAVGDRPLRQHQARGGVGQHERDAVRRVPRVDRHVARAGLQHRPYGHDHLRRPRHRHGHQVTGAHSARPQEPREPVGPVVQLREGQCDVAADHRRGHR